MKTIKTILLFTTIITFASISYSEAKECNYKSMVQQAICKGLGGAEGSGTSEKAVKVKKEKGEGFNKKYNSFADFFKKKKK